MTCLLNMFRLFKIYMLILLIWWSPKYMKDTLNDIKLQAFCLSFTFKAIKIWKPQTPFFIFSLEISSMFQASDSQMFLPRIQAVARSQTRFYITFHTPNYHVVSGSNSASLSFSFFIWAGQFLISFSLLKFSESMNQQIWKFTFDVHWCFRGTNFQF